MKSAEEWQDNELAGQICDDINGDDWNIFIRLVKQIQLDSIKEGMTRAAEIANYSSMGFEGDHYISAASQVEEAILEARDNLKELV